MIMVSKISNSYQGYCESRKFSIVGDLLPAVMRNGASFLQVIPALKKRPGFYPVFFLSNFEKTNIYFT